MAEALCAKKQSETYSSGNIQKISHFLSELALELGSIKINTSDPFTWTTGYRMPIYNDNRLLLSRPDCRRLVAEGMSEILRLKSFEPDCICGTATAGIAPATTLADSLNLPLAYVRSKPKAHGMGNQVEGLLRENWRTVVVEDLLSTGSSALSAVEAIRAKGAQVYMVLAVFSYGFDKCMTNFLAKSCSAEALLTLDTLWDVALSKGAISESDRSSLEAWQRDPFGWGEANGFPKRE